MFTKPRDREVVCHASAWDVTYDNDLRIKMCIEIDAGGPRSPSTTSSATTTTSARYYKLPILFQHGANDGFHEAIGDTHRAVDHARAT